MYPKVGETGLRLAMVIEMLYSFHYPVVDYGLDLKELEQREQGVFQIREKFNRTEFDRKPSPELKKQVHQALIKKKAKWRDVIPLRKWGKGK